MFDGRSYKQLCGWVHNNKAAKEKIEEDKAYKAHVQAMNEHSQNGVYLKFPMFSPSNYNITSPPLECYEQLLSWFEIFTFPQSIFIQADYHPKRNWASIFSRLKEEGGDRLTLLHRIIQETPGDRYVLSELRHVWERLRLNPGVRKARDEFIEVNLKLQEAEAKVAADPLPIIDHNLKQLQKFCKLLDETLWKRMEDCFGRFNHLFKKFLSELEIRRLAVEFENMLPQQFNTLMAISGYNRKLELASPTTPDFLRARFTLDVLFQFIIRARKHNNHMLVPFGMLFAMAQYACGHPLLATQIPIWLGISVSKRTMERRLEPWLQSYDNRVKMALRNVTSLLCVFDNLQDGRLLQFQQGQSSVFTRVTARFVMSMYLSRYPTWVYSYLKRPKLTYIQQAIPASYQMPALETTKDLNLADVLRSVFLGTYPDDLEQEGNPFDCSGVRVRTHQQIVGWCSELRAIKRYMSTKQRKGYKVDYTLQPPEFALNHARTAICEAMHRLRKNRDSNVFQMAAEFQRRVVRTWRYIPPVAELLILPVSVLDETTKIGATGIVIDFMVLHGLLEWDPRTTMYRLGSSWEDKWLFIVGDGLSIDRMFQFFDDIMAITDSSISSYRAAYRQAMTISQVVHRVVSINGDLHVRFHMLDAIYRLFYGGFLQCMQVRLKWKRVNASDVSKTYRLAHRLAMLVFEEVDRIVLDIFVYRTVSEEMVDGYLHHGQDEELAIFLAKGYRAYLERQVRESKDWLHRYVCNYLLIVRKYSTFLEAEQRGDALTMESVVVEFLPVFYITKKSNSFNTQLRLIELYYNRMPISILQQIRLNRTKRQKEGSGPSMVPKESALDQIMERLMPFFKSMSHSGTEAAFIKVLKMLTACQRAKHFVEYYRRNRADGETELSERMKEKLDIVGMEAGATADPWQRNKTTTVPKSRMNRILITEVLLLAKCHEVRHDHTIAIDNNQFWRALDHTTLEVHQKTRRCGNGKVEADSTHEYVMVQATGMVGGLTETGDEENQSETENKNDDDSEIDLEQALKEQDDDKSVGEDSVFSEDEIAVVEIEYENEFGGNETNETVEQDVTVENDEDNDNEEDATVDDVVDDDNDGGEVSESQVPETQVEDVILDDAEEVENENDEDADEDGEQSDGDAASSKKDDSVEDDSATSRKDEKFVAKNKLKGMKVVELNKLATTDVISHALEEICEKNIISGREWDTSRKEREHHFLRYKLFCRLEEMEEEGTGLGWSTRNDCEPEVTERLDRSLSMFKAIRNQ